MTNLEVSVGHADTGCLTRDIFGRVGDKWTLTVLASLCAGTQRFRELHREIAGISERVLTVTLRSLERDGLVSRKVFPTVPPRVEYTLTESGRSLLETVAPIFAWCDDHRDYVTRARAEFDATA